MLAHEMKLQWMVLAVFMVLSKWQHCAAGDQLVPCYFIFGDSLADNGNNNKLQTLAKVDYAPYGVDFRNGPTGRFCNGLTIVDIIAEILGFHNYIPPFATAREADMLYGLNYASGSAGIRDETGQELGECISLNMQLQNHHKTVQNLIGMLGNESALTYLNKCLYSVGMGNNDYLNNYFLPQFFPTSQEYTLEKYTQLLIEQYSQQLRVLSTAFFSPTPLMEIASLLFSLSLHQLSAVSSVSVRVRSKETSRVRTRENRVCPSKLLPAIDLLNDDLPDAKIIYINSYRIGEDSTVLDLKVNNTACCPSSAIAQCIPDQIPCQNRTQYMFWDSFHPTEIFNIFYAERSYSALDPSYAYELIHMIFAI
ncbi:GDSL-LIKE LIPASE/ACYLHYDROLASE-RELATED [Salix viminalis]|uniref:GDSL-LIKE LIPASE/ACYLHYDROLASE-RELATED n=1 Tax=Salix viminalis TaxID=40686 RepID=A0A9Q0USQ0_SALVM|nr:GDSL-LIKE LIPASE/ACYLHYDROLASE-RELATED [Salix viminalis]